MEYAPGLQDDGREDVALGEGSAVVALVLLSGVDAPRVDVIAAAPSRHVEEDIAARVHDERSRTPLPGGGSLAAGAIGGMVGRRRGDEGRQVDRSLRVGAAFVRADREDGLDLRTLVDDPAIVTRLRKRMHDGAEHGQRAAVEPDLGEEILVERQIHGYAPTLASTIISFELMVDLRSRIGIFTGISPPLAGRMGYGSSNS